MFSEVDPISPRFVLAHIKWLPLESAFVAEQRGGQIFRGWDGDRYMAADLINSIRALQYILILANRNPDKPAPKPPEPYPLPDKVIRKQRQQSPEPGSFAFIAKQHIAAVRKQRERGIRCPEEAQEAKK